MSLQDRIAATRRLLAEVERDHARPVFASSFGAEDMVVLDLIVRDGLAIETFMLDTGRLPPHTLALVERVKKAYGVDVSVYQPWPGAVDAYAETYGLDGFYESVEARKACCGVRKVEPLRRALSGRRAWVTGLRRDQSDTRAELEAKSYDTVHRLWKYNPLADWTHEDVWAYIRENNVPYNALHDRGYPSIGCDPCTRAIKPGEHPRAGRWWWENEGARKECGLHEIAVKVVA